MADTITTTGLIVLAQNYRGDVVRQINRRTVALRVLPKRDGEGKNVAWAAEGSGALAENYSEGADATNFAGDSQVPATLGWGLARSAFHVSKLAIDTSVTSRTPLGNQMLWSRHLVNANAALATKLEAEVFTGNGTGGQMVGLDLAIGSTTNTYAGIDRTANAFWRPTVVDPGAPTALTLAQIRDDIRLVYEACGMNPDFAFCTPTIFNKVVALFDATRRIYSMPGVQNKSSLDLNLDYNMVEVDGMQFFKAKDATAGQIYYCNSDYVHIEILPDATSMAIANALKVVPDDGFGPVPLGFTYEKLAKQGPSERAEVLSQMQLVVERPNAFAVRKNVA